MEKFLFILCTHFHIIQGNDFIKLVLVRVIHGVQHAVDTQHLLRKLDGGLLCHAAVGDVEVFLLVLTWRFLDGLHALVTLVCRLWLCLEPGIGGQQELPSESRVLPYPSRIKIRACDWRSRWCEWRPLPSGKLKATTRLNMAFCNSRGLLQRADLN